MSRKPESEKWILGGLIAFVAIFVVFFPSYGWKIRNYLTPRGNAASSDEASLRAQNEVLLADLAKFQQISSELPAESANDIRAMVFSRYPFNFKNEMLVNAGSYAGVKTGAAATFQGVLVGRVTSVFTDSAVVSTLFDNNFKIPVRIGSGGYDGLLQGGSYPMVRSIARNAAVAPGDIVYAAAQGIPYGLPLGEVAATSSSPDNLFQEASMKFAYDANAIETVFIAK